MVVTTITAFEGNFEDDGNAQSIVVAIADLTTSFTNEHIAEAGLSAHIASNVRAGVATAFWLDLGRQFEEIKKSLKPKERFRDVVETLG
ncbi:MAG: hypothetical protein PUP92_30720, partial [Rhizonema sp. PD38]|nr:hypothetical protein [Rhizonema sp. PD38]